MNLSQHKVYFTPIFIGKKTTLLEKVSYGGEDSESVPCGFNSEWVVRNNRPSNRNNRKVDKVFRKYKTIADNKILGLESSNKR